MEDIFNADCIKSKKFISSFHYKYLWWVSFISLLLSILIIFPLNTRVNEWPLSFYFAFANFLVIRLCVYESIVFKQKKFSEHIVSSSFFNIFWLYFEGFLREHYKLTILRRWREFLKRLGDFLIFYPRSC